MRKLPKISIITPSFNQGSYIERTIQSILSQNYPNLEHIVVDGGSNDQTIKILRQYKKHITYISERDNGQSDAINKGLRMAKGDIVGYVNSDDFLEEGALQKVGEFFVAHKDALWVTGKCRIVDKKAKETRRFVTWYKNLFLKHLRSHRLFCIVQYISQPSTFWKKSVTGEVGYFDETLHYDMDYDYWLRIWKSYPLFFIEANLASYRVHSDSKAVTSPETQFRVEHEILRRYTSSPILLFFHKLHTHIALLLYRLFFMRSAR